MFNFKIRKTERIILKWSVLPTILYLLVCYFKIKGINDAFYVTIGLFLIFLFMLFYKIYSLFDHHKH